MGEPSAIKVIAKESERQYDIIRDLEEQSKNKIPNLITLHVSLLGLLISILSAEYYLLFKGKQITYLQELSIFVTGLTLFILFYSLGKLLIRYTAGYETPIGTNIDAFYNNFKEDSECEALEVIIRGNLIDIEIYKIIQISIFYYIKISSVYILFSLVLFAYSIFLLLINIDLLYPSILIILGITLLFVSSSLFYYNDKNKALKKQFDDLKILNEKYQILPEEYIIRLKKVVSYDK